MPSAIAPLPLEGEAAAPVVRKPGGGGGGNAPPFTRLSDASLFSKTTDRSLLSRVFMSSLCLAAHLLFLYGQTAVMWYLYFEVRVDAQIQAHSLPSRLAFRALQLSNPLAVATTLNHTIQEFTYWDAVHGLWTGHTGPVPHDPNVVPDARVLGPGVWGKISALILILFSAIWPHVKLINLHIQYYWKCPQGSEERRTTILYWLDTFGKWSLADVFVICILLAVLNVDIPVDASLLLSVLQEQLGVIAKDLGDHTTSLEAARQICRGLLFINDDVCTTWPSIPGNGISPIADCSATPTPCTECACRLERAFPTVGLLMLGVDSLLRGMTASGQALAVLRVAGRSGIYVFCLATLTSLGLSALVDLADHRTRSKNRLEKRTQDETKFFQALTDARQATLAAKGKESLVGRGSSLWRNRALSELINAPTRSSALSLIDLHHQQQQQQQQQQIENAPPSDSLHDDETRGRGLYETHRRRHESSHEEAYLSMIVAEEDLVMASPTAWLSLTCVFALIVVFLAVLVPTLQRRIPGSVTDIVARQLNVELTRDYSIYELVVLAGEAGGLDILLMLVFGLFVVVGPFLRAFLLVMLTTTPTNTRVQERSAFLVNSLGVFAGWDVLLVALFLVTLEMPRITQGIVSPSTAICRVLHQLGAAREPSYCISIEFFFLQPEFLLIPIGTFVIVACAARVVRVAFFVFNPFGDEYPGMPRSIARFAECYSGQFRKAREEELAFREQEAEEEQHRQLAAGAFARLEEGREGDEGEATFEV